MKNSTYSFEGQEEPYAAYRPNWSAQCAEHALAKAGVIKDVQGVWHGTPDGQSPVVACLGAGTGSDASLFKALGCTVYLVDPNQTMLDKARDRLERIPTCHAEYLCASAVNTGIPEKVDLIVAAQAAHTFKSLYAEQDKPTEELTRKHWETLLRDKENSLISIWYYNPDPSLDRVKELDGILRENYRIMRKVKPRL